MKNKILFTLVWLVASYFFYEFFKSVDFARAWKELEKASGGWLICAFLFNFLILVVWTSLWSVLIPQGIVVSFPRLFQSNCLMSSSCNTLPFPGGHTVGLVLLAKIAKVKHSIALSILALDQMLEGIVKVMVMILAASFSPLPEQMQMGIKLFIILIVIFAGSMFYAAHKNPKIKTLKERTSLSKFDNIKGFVAQWIDHLELLRNYRVFCLGLILALVMMALQTLGLWAAQKSLGQELPFWTTILVMAALNLAMIFPLTPGNFGVYETTAFLIYKFSGLSAEIALTLAFLQHICFLIPMVSTGWIVLFMQFLNSIKTKISEKNCPD